ncbi:MAG: transposase [Patescibacteria group bacterium]
MPQFKPYNQNQSMLLPMNIRDCFPKDHICFAINDAVDNLNIDCLEKSYSSNGCPAYNPKMLIKLLFYGYTQGTRSSRKL